MRQHLWILAISLATIAVNALPDPGRKWPLSVGLGLLVLAFGEASSPALELIEDLRRERRLNPSQERLARLVGQGKTNSEIAVSLAITRHAVGHRIGVICSRLGLASRDDLQSWAQRHYKKTLLKPTTHRIPRRGRQKEPWEWIAEVGAAIALMALGVGMYVIPEVPKQIDFAVILLGLAGGVLSTVLYAWDRFRARSQPPGEG